jgi:hypothetical protein
VAARRASQSTTNTETLATKSSVAYYGSISRPNGTKWNRAFAGHFAVISGLTTTNVTRNGINYRRHILSTAGTSTLQVSMINDMVQVCVVAGGGGGGAPADGFGAGPGSRGGSFVGQYLIPYPGSYTVTCGAGGASGGAVQIGGGGGQSGGQGGDSIFGFTAGGGGGGGGGPSAGGTPNRVGNPNPAANGGFQTLVYTNFGLASTVGAGGGQAVGPYPGSPASAGTAGGVAIEYEVLT